MTNEEFQGLVLEQLAGLKTDISDLKTDVSALKTDVSALKTDVSSLREQTSENSQFIQALLHRTEELDAKLDGLAVNTASKESIADLDAKFDVLNKRLFQ